MGFDFAIISGFVFDAEFYVEEDAFFSERG